MTTQTKTDASQGGFATAGGMAKQDSSNFNEWTECMPKSVTFADCMSASDAAKAWNDMYKLVGIATGTEKQKKMFRAWAYVQGSLNGTSRQGDYATIDNLADGTEVASAVIPRVTGRAIRKFFRASMEESYYALKTTKVMETYPRFVTRCAAMGIGAHEAFATSDWMDDCPYFTPSEANAHAKSFNYGIARARRARDGRTLEQVEDAETAATIRVNGPDMGDVGRAGPVDF